MGIKIFSPGGIDQKSSDLVRDPRDLRDARNVQYNIRGEFVKRDGVDTDADMNGIYSSYPILSGESGVVIKSDFIFLKSLGGYFYFDGVGYRFRKEGLSVPMASFALGIFYDPITNTPPFSNLSGGEYLNTFIFTHQINQRYTMKFDGGAVYRAGLPAPEFSSITGSGSGFILAFFDFIDMAGNNIYGPANIIPNSTNSGSFVVKKPSEYGNYGDRLQVNLAGVVTIGPTSRTLSNVVGGTFTPGKKFVFRTKLSGNVQVEISRPGTVDYNLDTYVVLEVESFSGSNVTFTLASFNNKTIRITPTVPATYNVVYSYRVRVFYSDSEVTGYIGLLNPATEIYILEDGFVTPTQTISYSIPLTGDVTLLSDIYDITTSKIQPPKCKYISTYGYQIVCGNALSFWDFNNKETVYTNNDLIMYSDISTGDLGENFSEANRQLIGNTYDGEITGLARSKDSLIAFKDRSIFSLDGVLIPGQFSLRKIETDEIGCVSDKSILAVEGTVIFQGQDGLYGINGYSIKKITVELDPFFSTIDNSLTRSCVRSNSDQYLFWTDQGVVVLDYDFKKLFIWNNIDASKGLTVDNSGSVRMFNASTAKKFITAKNDSGAAINAYIDTAWFDMSEPSVLKKATDIRVFALNNLGQTIQLNYYFDWDVSKTKGPFPMDFSLVGTKTVLRKLDIIQNQSFSFRLSNNVINEDMNITGFEITSGVIQTKDKNVK